jgi:predicted lipoprotein with Yx(FWY)xxD motif
VRTLMIGAAGAMAAGLLMSACSSGSTAAQPGAAAPAPSSSSAAPPASAPATPSAAPSAAAGVTVSLRKVPDIEDKVLVASHGRVIYLFEKDKNGTSSCSGACASAWPPVTVIDAPTAGTGVSSAMLSTIHRPDGTTQVVYGGHPLYFFSGDHKAGQAKGQAVDAYGAEWYVVSAKGSKVDSDDE